jgi:hypothetical protein
MIRMSGKSDIASELPEDDGDDISGYYDDGTKVNPELIIKPSLCLSCKHEDDPSQEQLCTLNRMDQQDEDDFKCGVYEKRTL